MLVISGCASINPQPGFNQVKQQVSERLGKRIHWKQNSTEDRVVEASVRKMLQDDLTVEEAVQIALLNNPGLQATYEEIGIAQADVVQAGLLKNPVLTTFQTKERSGDRAVNLEFEFAWDFLGVLTRHLRVRAAEQSYKETRLRVTGEIMSLAAEVRRTFYQAQSYQQMLELLQQVVSATDAAVLAAERMRAAGNITRLQLEQEKALHYEAKLQLSNAETMLNSYREQLNGMLGLWGTATRWSMATHLPDVPEDRIDVANVEKRAVANSLQLEIYRAQINHAAQQAGVENVESIIQDLELGYRIERSGGAYENGPSVGFSIPIFDFGQAKRARAHRELEALLARYKDAAIRLRAGARAAASNVRIAREREHYMRKVLLPLRENITSGEQLNYNAMQIGVFKLLLAQRLQIATAMSYIEALRNYWLARTSAGQVVNGGMMGMYDSMGMGMSMGSMSAGGDTGGGH
jgi:cobalt-zinc-cadmium efflux system outer membrane protein